jgi:hypothetical protein
LKGIENPFFRKDKEVNPEKESKTEKIKFRPLTNHFEYDENANFPYDKAKRTFYGFSIDKDLKYVSENYIPRQDLDEDLKKGKGLNFDKFCILERVIAFYYLNKDISKAEEYLEIWDSIQRYFAKKAKMEKEF